MASVSDTVGGQAYSISTFSMLCTDTLTPAFESHVTKDSLLNVASLGRSIHGLGLNGIRHLQRRSMGLKTAIYSADDTFQSTSSTSDTGREININASLPFPFSDESASTRYANLPQQPRWSPWLNSVAYLENSQL